MSRCPVHALTWRCRCRWGAAGEDGEGGSSGDEGGTAGGAGGKITPAVAMQFLKQSLTVMLRNVTEGVFRSVAMCASPAPASLSYLAALARGVLCSDHHSIAYRRRNSEIMGPNFSVWMQMM